MTRLVARLLMVTGIGHALLGFMLFSTPLGEIVREGFIGTIRYGQFERSTAFWFLLFAPACVLLGQLVEHAMEREDRWLLTVVAWNLLTIGGVGALIMPVSGFWILIATAPLVSHLERRLRTDSAALADGALSQPPDFPIRPSSHAASPGSAESPRRGRCSMAQLESAL